LGKRLSVLIVNDSKADVESLLRELEGAGFEPEFTRVESAHELSRALDEQRWDLVISAYMMRSFSAHAALAVMRNRGLDLPFIVVSRERGESHAVAAIKAGADDYILTDNLRLLGPTVERELRRAEQRRQKRRDEAAMRTDLAQLRAVFEEAPVVMLLLDRERRIRKANRRAGELGGRPPQAMAGLRSGEALRCLYALEDPRGCEYGSFCENCGLRRVVLNALEKGTRGHAEVKLPLGRDANREAWLLVSAERVNAAGEQMVLLCLHDVTALRGEQEEFTRDFVRLRRALEATIQAMASAVEARDPHTSGHQRRVAKLACAIAEQMGLSEDRIEGIRVAGVIHDLGKIFVRVEVLSKPGRVTEAEFNQLKSHPQVGYDILKEIVFPWPVAEIILQHHERLDGSGYPAGLSGEQILLEARILAVADVVEAMTHHRPHRPAFTIDEALNEISRNSGKLYDKGAAEACIELFRRKGFTFD